MSEEVYPRVLKSSTEDYWLLVISINDGLSTCLVLCNRRDQSGFPSQESSFASEQLVVEDPEDLSRLWRRDAETVQRKIKERQAYEKKLRFLVRDLRPRELLEDFNVR